MTRHRMLAPAADLIACAGVLIAAWLLTGAPAWATSPARELGPVVAMATPRDGYVGRLAVAPARGPAGTPVHIEGSGFPPEQDLDVVWRTVDGRWKVAAAEYHGREYTPIGYRLARVRSGKDGRIAVRFVAPSDFGFLHDIVVQQGDRLLTQAAFHLEMTARIIGPARGPIGTPIAIEVSGVGWRELEGSWVLLYDNKFTGFLSAVTTGGVARFDIPAAGHIGRHIIEVQHSDFGSPYRNTQQSPTPDRPTFRLDFTVTPGPPVLPPPPPAQAQKLVRALPPQGDIVASPPFAGVGQPVVVSGSGFDAGKDYTLEWSAVVGNRMSGQGWQERTRPIARARADARGRVDFRFDTPDDLGGVHTLSVDAQGRRREGVLWIAPTALPLDVARGPVGTTFRIHLKGVGWTETANIYTVLYDNAISGYACAFNSQGDVEIIMIATGEPGWHFIDLVPSIYKGRETRPNNYRLPQLTFADDHPGEDLPRFRFAFEVTGDARGGH